MSNPQQPEVARSRKTPHQDPDAVAAVVDGRSVPTTGGPTGPVPTENQPGHRPEKDQDKPDLDAFAAKLGVTDQPADEVVDQQLHAPPRSPEAAGPGPAPKPVLVGLLGAVAVLVGLILAKRRRWRRR